MSEAKEANIEVNLNDLPEDLRELLGLGDALQEVEDKAKHYTEVTFPLIENIFKTLPVSYYAGRAINATLSPTERGSFYNWFSDEIVISALSIASMMEHMEETHDIESNIRALLYHEISHVLLTPKDFFGSYTGHKADALNVFEDERIETLLCDKYYGVDFKRNVIELNNFTGEPATDAFGAFYDIVRFRDAKAAGLTDNYVTDVENMIKRYRAITAATPGHSSSTTYYCDAVIQFYMKITKDWLEQHKHDSLESKLTDYDSKSESQQMQAVESVLEDESKEREKKGSQNAGEGQAIVVTVTEGYDGKASTRTSASSDSSKTMKQRKLQNSKIRTDENGKAQAQQEDLAEKINKERSHLSPSESALTEITPQEMLSTLANKFINTDLTNQFKDIIDNFLSRSKNNSAAIERYSGVLNPRSLTRDDWRIFTYKSTSGPIKGFDKFHLNLFIDTSGSYRNNQDATNTILKSLDTLEKQYPFFSFDLVTCQVSETKRSKDERYIVARGGNYLDEKVWDIFKSLQDPQALNYNIALFDGDAFTDCRGSAERAYKNFGVFNSSKCSIISDSDNKSYINRYAPQAHTIIVNDGGRRQSYSDLLFNNIILAMKRALL